MPSEDSSASAENGGRTPSAPAPDAIRAELDRILGSAEFQLPERGRAFLRYIVDESLAGRAERIKAYSIAVEVLGRENGLRPDDPVVRTEAARLRRALERYYLVAGHDDPVRIDVPKGGYAPAFTRRFPLVIRPPAVECVPPSEPSIALAPSWRRAQWLIAAALAVFTVIAVALHWRPDQTASRTSASIRSPPKPTLLIAPFADLGEGAQTKLFALGLTEELLTALPRFKEIRVFGRETSEAIPPGADLLRLQHELGARYMLAGSVRVSGGRARVTVRLTESTAGEIMWSSAFEEDLRSRGIFSLQSDIAGKVASAVAQPYGAISKSDFAAAQQQPPDDPDAYLCMLRFYAYRAELRADKHAEARACLERAVARFPSFATGWAMLSIAYLDEDRFLFNARVGSRPPLEQALDAARRAVKLDPENARAQQALMLALFFNRRGDIIHAVAPNQKRCYHERLWRIGRPRPRWR